MRLKYFTLIAIVLFAVSVFSNALRAQNQQNFFSSEFPEIRIITNNNPYNEYLFLGLTVGSAGHLLILDNATTAVFYKKVEGVIFNFLWQENGELTYNIYPTTSYGLDSSGVLTNTFVVPDSFKFNFHELTVQADSSYYVLSDEAVVVDLSQIVPGGQTDAQLITQNIHHMDAQDNEIWRWRSFDHYDILDADSAVDLTQSFIDWTHCNSIKVDYDGNILLSTRNFNEVTKINRQTCEIIWRLGGERNQFQFIDDNRRFARQHDAKRNAVGNLILFDNGVRLVPQYSSLVEYELDEDSLTASLIRRFSRDETVWSRIRGGVQGLPNGNHLICWGESDDPAVTEINSNNEIVYEISFPNGGHRYRSFRFPWKTNYFSVNTDSLNFGIVPVGDSLTKNIWVKNNENDTAIINQFYFIDSMFTVLNELPIYIVQNDSVKLDVKFEPYSEGYFEDRLNIRYVTDTLLLGQQVDLFGLTNIVMVDDNNNETINAYSLFQNYPNPFSAEGGSAYGGNPGTTIKFTIPLSSPLFKGEIPIYQDGGFITLKVYDVLGNEIATLVNKEFMAGSYEVDFSGRGLSSGIYFYSIEAIPADGTEYFHSVKKMILLK